ncbi:hypothetical protein [Streptomyces sp. NBC_00102]|uniref:hypothetical protein n=1 Tax=Streptomyces sp. NBC_00102 TaxID=2975652 RepID=UPI002253F3E8|nr:hypothetical protein [Streptomyces sp. NBC_00102]MCX5398497.1 hypothetical protein [Streptomyces sp. NBC_00102]
MTNHEPRGIFSAAGLTRKDIAAAVDWGTREAITFARSAVDFHGADYSRVQPWREEIQDARAMRTAWGLAPIS